MEDKTICLICGCEYYFDEDTPTKFAMVCSNGCLERLERSSIANEVL